MADIRAAVLQIDLAYSLDRARAGSTSVLCAALSMPSGRQICPITAPDTQQVVGLVSFDYLAVSPFPQPHLLEGRSMYWKNTVRLPTLIGHRGSGAEENAVHDGFRHTHVQENSVLSFVTAASLGAEYVEFGALTGAEACCRCGCIAGLTVGVVLHRCPADTGHGACNLP